MGMAFRMYERYVKRCLDVMFAAVALMVFSPVFLIAAIAIKLDSPGKVFFVQQRVGKGKRLFRIYKFRTMRSDAPKNLATHLFSESASYVTSVGSFLRRSSMDELPQLVNILKGDMALVGPRPALWNQDDLIAAREEQIRTDGKTANDVRPGLTGWAQINGRDELDIAEKARYDGEYINKMSFWFDLRCLLGTFLPVIRAKGFSDGGHSGK